MAFEVNHPRYGGPKKGQKQRTKEMTNLIFDMLEADMYDGEEGKSRFLSDMKLLSAKERMDVRLKLLKLVMPTIASVAIEDNKTVTSIQQLMKNMALYHAEEKR